MNRLSNLRNLGAALLAIALIAAGMLVFISPTEPNAPPVLTNDLPPVSTAPVMSDPLTINERRPGDIRNFGAIGDGVTDDSAAIQAAVDAELKVFFPPGRYRADSVIKLRNGSHLFGDKQGTATVIKTKDNGAAQGVLFVDSGSATEFVDDVVVEDLTFDGQVESMGFSEHRHLLSFHGVRNLLIKRVTFRGYRGDGLYIGSGTSIDHERHNLDVTVSDSVFDGVNSNNRNGISIIDGDGVRILRNTFRNTTRDDMPGPIDLETDHRPYHMIRNIEIVDNKIESYGGHIGISIDTKAAKLANPLKNLTIRDNRISGATKANAIGFSVVTNDTISDAVPSMNVNITGNIVDDSNLTKIAPFRLIRLSGVNVSHNQFINGTVAEIGSITEPELTAYDMTFNNNYFYQNGNTYGALVIGSTQRITLNKNTIATPDLGRAVRAITFYSTPDLTRSSSHIKITNNRWIKGDSQKYLIQSGSHVFDPLTNEYFGNVVIGDALANEFPFE